jgi:2,3-bisphosphoglycerate-independent phosphoglycerate mutase
VGMKSMYPVALVILDGFGYSTDKKHNAIAEAHMPNFNEWWQQYAHSIIQAAGTAVGLPDNVMGNSEVGHLTIGSGRIIKQTMTVWLESIEDGSFSCNRVLLEGFKQLQEIGGALHIMGLLSDAGVHSHEKTLYASIAAAVDAGIKKIIIHPFLDGRDVAPQSAYDYLERLAQFIKPYNDGNNNKCHVFIGSIHGRFYVMDRDNNWERIEKSYRVLTEKSSFAPSFAKSFGGHGKASEDRQSYETWERVLESNYAQNITDEFIVPTQLDPDGIVHNGDGILFCNVRPDRARELTRCFVQSDLTEQFTQFPLKPLSLTFFMTPVVYDVHLPTTVLFPRAPVLNTLKDVLSKHGKTIFAIAETEKYAHVTYFFRGENEEPVKTETRIMIPSIHTQNYINNPEMSAEKITDAVITSLHENPCDFYLINYANADMVGHSGDFDATVKAVECLDVQLKLLYDVIVQKMDGTLYITADHGKAEQMYDAITEQPQTAHTSNPVPFLMIKKGVGHAALPIAELANIAPFILQNMGIDVPHEMKKLL